MVCARFRINTPAAQIFRFVVWTVLTLWIRLPMRLEFALFLWRVDMP
jgi:hypothetical protein